MNKWKWQSTEKPIKTHWRLIVCVNKKSWIPVPLFPSPKLVWYLTFVVLARTFICISEKPKRRVCCVATEAWPLEFGASRQGGDVRRWRAPTHQGTLSGPAACRQGSRVGPKPKSSNNFNDKPTHRKKKKFCSVIRLTRRDRPPPRP